MIRTTRAALLLTLTACVAPPEAPQGLDASARYMMRNFYQDDAVFGAGVQGYLNWFEDGGGKELVGVAPSLETVETSFTVSSLTAEDVEALPLDAEILLDPGAAGSEDDVVGPRDLSKAVGVIAVDDIPCSWQQVEAVLLGPNAAEVFKTYEAYERTYLSSESAFFAASTDGAFDPIPEAFDPHADGFDDTPYARSVLFTNNLVDPAPQPIVGNLPPFALSVEARHGSYLIDDAPVGLSAVISYAPSAMWEESGGDGMRQTFAVELLAELASDRTLRMLAVWSEPEILGIDPSTPIALVTAVNQARNSSEDMKAACEALKAR